SSAEYQIVTSADGHIVYRVNTDSGSIVACLPRASGNNPCWLMQRGNRHLEDEAPAENVSAAAPAPIQAQPATPPAVTAQPAPRRLPAPQNTAAPAARGQEARTLPMDRDAPRRDAGDAVETGFLGRLGPGLITGAADDDPSGIGT